VVYTLPHLQNDKGMGEKYEEGKYDVVYTLMLMLSE
jgi:hypothetical protein